MTGPPKLRLVRIEYAAAGIHAFEFRHPGGAPLPAFDAGAHVDLHLGNGMLRSYSLLNDPRERHRYVLGIKRDPKGRGGSAWVHEQLRVGDLVEVGAPRCNFPLDETRAHSLLIAGGIGITPIACMAQRLRAIGRPFALHYSVKRRDEAAFLDLLAGPELQLHVDDEAGRLLDIAALLRQAPAGTAAYCCGPTPMLEAFEAAARTRPDIGARIERFAATEAPATGGGYRVELAASKKSVFVPAGRTLLEALRDAGLNVMTSCEQGICGTCETRVIAGRPDHRDALLSDEEKLANRTMMICCSGSLDAELVLDL